LNRVTHTLFGGGLNLVIPKNKQTETSHVHY
jgi:hypothetical protein